MKGSDTRNLILEQFYEIDMAGKSCEENDAIMVSIRNSIFSSIKNYLIQKREKDKRLSMINEYRSFLHGLKKITQKQENILSYLESETDAKKLLDTVFDLRKEMEDYTAKLTAWESFYCDRIFTEKERDVVSCVKLYNHIDKYCKNIERYEVVRIKDKSILGSLTDWKSYFFFVICNERQKKIRQLFLMDYKNRQENNETANELEQRLCAIDFQGQLSKNIYSRRKQLKLTQAELSKISGVDRSMIAKIERLQQPTTVETAVRLVSALDMGIAICPLSKPFTKDSSMKITARSGGT